MPGPADPSPCPAEGGMWWHQVERGRRAGPQRLAGVGLGAVPCHLPRRGTCTSGPEPRGMLLTGGTQAETPTTGAPCPGALPQAPAARPCLTGSPQAAVHFYGCGLDSRRAGRCVHPSCAEHCVAHSGLCVEDAPSPQGLAPSQPSAETGGAQAFRVKRRGWASHRAQRGVQWRGDIREWNLAYPRGKGGGTEPWTPHPELGSGPPLCRRQLRRQRAAASVHTPCPPPAVRRDPTPSREPVDGLDSSHPCTCRPLQEGLRATASS